MQKGQQMVCQPEECSYRSQYYLSSVKGMNLGFRLRKVVMYLNPADSNMSKPKATLSPIRSTVWASEPMVIISPRTSR
jgi:hypothetical protein